MKTGTKAPMKIVLPKRKIEKKISVLQEKNENSADTRFLSSLTGIRHIFFIKMIIFDKKLNLVFPLVGSTNSLDKIFFIFNVAS